MNGTTVDKQDNFGTRASASHDIAIQRSNFLYYGLLFYLFLFYAQPAARVTALAPLRIEFFVGAILIVVAMSKFASGDVRFGENRMNIVAVLFVVTIMVMIPFAYVKTRAMDTFVHQVKFFAIYLLIVAAVDNEQKLKGFVYCYMAMIALLFVEPFIMSLQGKGFIYNNHMMRLAGVTNYFGHPNQLGGMTAENLPFFYYFMRYERSKTLKIIFFALIVMGLRVIMLTQSRTGFVGVIVFCLSLFVLSKRKAASLAIIAVASVAVWFAAPDQTKARFLTMADINKVITTEEADFRNEQTRAMGSMANRWELIRRGFVTFLANPIAGVGPGCFISYNGRQWGYWFPPHNTYIQALAEMGIIGFTIFLAVLVNIIKNLSTTRRILGRLGRKPSVTGTVTAALMVHMAILLAVSLFGQDLYENYWWLAGGMSVVLLRIARSLTQECPAVNANP